MFSFFSIVQLEGFLLEVGADKNASSSLAGLQALEVVLCHIIDYVTVIKLNCQLHYSVH